MRLVISYTTNVRKSLVTSFAAAASITSTHTSCRAKKTFCLIDHDGYFKYLGHQRYKYSGQDGHKIFELDKTFKHLGLKSLVMFSDVKSLRQLEPQDSLLILSKLLTLCSILLLMYVIVICSSRSCKNRQVLKHS